MEDGLVDLLIIGGGINGAGIARDAAGRGLSVILCEKEDLAQHTSSKSTKLIHGGLRYLELYDFALVRHALQEREVLLRAAPHIIWPLRFILPHHRTLRPRWMIRLGLFLYDHLGGRKILPKSASVDLRAHISGQPLKPEFRYGFEYSDCWVQDARLVVLNAQDARARGARILIHTECIGLQRRHRHWEAILLDHRTGRQWQQRSRAIVNASGPWVEKTLGLDGEVDSGHGVRLVKGSHIVTPRLFDHDYPYIFQNADKRIIFAIPYENDFTLIGTTDIEIPGPPSAVTIDRSEIDYLCTAVSEYFSQPVQADDVVWSYAGVRPLFDDASQNASKVTRDYVLQLDVDGPPMLSVFGGKITTFRKLAEQALDMLQKPLNFSGADWTAEVPLPGGDLENADFDRFLQQCRQQYGWLDEPVLIDYCRNYGTLIHTLLHHRNSMRDLGEYFGGGLYECEVRYLLSHEWASSAEDILWRRTKKGLRLSTPEQERLTAWLAVVAWNLRPRRTVTPGEGSGQ